MLTDKEGNSLFQLSATERAKQRPDDFEELSPQEQWEIDKRLGILDWDGKEDT
jgi:hypothetical protein